LPWHPPSPRQIKASAFKLAPDTNNTDLITMATSVTVITTRTNIGGTNGSGGTGTIIVTITIGTTTGIDLLRFRITNGSVRRRENDSFIQSFAREIIRRFTEGRDFTKQITNFSPFDDSDSFNGNLEEFELLCFAPRHEVFCSSAPHPNDPAHLSETAKHSV
jgi:hypothetical protein